MKIVIDIPERDYDLACNYPNALIATYAHYIKDGTPYEEKPQGEWIVQRLHNGLDDVYCPFCNARPRRSDYGYYIKDKFCHECGADLRVKGD